MAAIGMQMKRPRESSTPDAPAASGAALDGASPEGDASRVAATATAPDAGDASRRSKRARRPRAMNTAVPDAMGREEAVALRAALQKSLVDVSPTGTVQLPEAAVFHPTVEEFADPMKYIASITPKCLDSGIAKIVPPPGWAPPCGLDASSTEQTFCTRLQSLHKLGQGEPFPDGRKFNLSDYQKHAAAFKAKYPDLLPTPQNVAAALAEQGLAPGALPPLDALASRMEEVYWGVVERGSPAVAVEYGNDQDTDTYGSGFLRRDVFGARAPRKVGVGGMGGTTLEVTDYAVTGHAVRGMLEPNPLSQGLKSAVPPAFGDREYYRNTGWNLNNMPHLPSSVLRLVAEAVGGINVPWLYMGMLFSTFCWHVEDNYLFSINYMHHGEAKLWYGVPGEHARAFEKVMREHLHVKFKSDPDLLFQLTTMLSPATLSASNVPVRRTVQHPGEFIITMPRAYHGGFSLGFNIAEACNFALPEWIPWGRKAIDVYRTATVPRPSVFSHEKLMLDLARWSLTPACEFTARQLVLIVTELHTILRAEVRERLALMSRGFTPSCRFFVRNDADARGECVKCRRACYLSAVVCRSCGVGRMVCPKHYRALCACTPGPSGRLLLYWHTTQSLTELEQGLVAKIRAMGGSLAFKPIAAAPAPATTDAGTPSPPLNPVPAAGAGGL